MILVIGGTFCEHYYNLKRVPVLQHPTYWKSLSGQDKTLPKKELLKTILMVV
jgi:hypothetical protein